MINFLGQQAAIIPILLPFLTAIFLFMLEERLRKLKALLSLNSALLLLICNIILLFKTAGDEGALSYSLSGYPAPFGIVLVLDKLAAIMLFLVSFIGFSALCFSRVYWERTGHKFYAFMHFLFMGLNGVILTGDLFNLFVFFEVMLAASYGLALHSFDKEQVKFGFHYVILNLLASLFFLLGVGLIYSATGKLNFADLALTIGKLDSNRFFFIRCGFSLLGVAFLTKLGMWPVNFWLAPLYSRVPAPIGAVFVLLSKVGFYILMRMAFLFWPMQTDLFYQFGQKTLYYGGVVTLLYGAIAILAAKDIKKIAAYLVIISSGLLLTSLGFFEAKLNQAMLYYLLCSTLSLSAFFLLTELAERLKLPAWHLLAVHMERGEEEKDFENEPTRKYLNNGANFVAIAYFICVFLFVGLPPLAGFISKFSLVSALLNPEGYYSTKLLSHKEWLFIALLLFSSFSTLIVLLQQGIAIFWTDLQEEPSKIYLLEFFPILLLLVSLLLLTLLAPFLYHYINHLTQDLANPLNYIESVLLK